MKFPCRKIKTWPKKINFRKEKDMQEDRKGETWELIEGNCDQNAPDAD